MGITYHGPYADAIGYHAHEGYAARILPDGTETGTWTYATRDCTGHRAHCSCGWRGTTGYAPTQAGEDLADEEWDSDHLQPLIRAEAERHTVPATALLDLVRELRKELVAEPGAKPHQLADRSRGVADAAARIEHLMDDLVRRAVTW